MSYLYDYPHTRKYDDDLGFLIQRYFELTTDFNNTREDFEKLKYWVTNQIGDNNLQKLISNKLEKWLEDGTLENLFLKINSVIKYHDTTINMIKDTTLKEGQIVYTSGYSLPYDNGEGCFNISKNSSDTKFYFTLNNGLYAILIGESVKTRSCGMVDSLEDCGIFINNLLSKYNTIYINKGKYVIKTPIVINRDNIIIKGESMYNKSVLYNQWCDCFRITENSRFLNLSNISITGDNHCSGIAFEKTGSSTATITRIKIHDLTINNQLYGITDFYLNGVAKNSADITLWNCILDNISFYYYSKTNNYGFYISNQTTGLCNTFNQIVMGDTTNYFNNIRGIFNNCNFGFVENTTLTLTPSFIGQFNSCNFECDSNITNNAILLNCQNSIFTTCLFSSRNTNNYFINFNENNRGVVFDDCRFNDIKNTNKIFSPNNNSKFSSVVFNNFSNKLPNLNNLSYYSSNMSLRNGVTVIEYGSGDTASIPKNSLVIKNHKLCYWNGEKFVNYDGSDN